MAEMLRAYRPSEAGRDGYPLDWHACQGCAGAGWRCAANDGPADVRRGTCCTGASTGCPSMNGCPDCTAHLADGGIETTGSIKAYVRALAGHRCIRCQHPFVVGETPGEWSPCDERCVHDGDPGRLVEDYGRDAWLHGDELGVIADWPEPGQTRPRAVEHHKMARRILAENPRLRRIEARWRVLTVHHLDGDKLNCRWWNLAALCQRCHLTIQGKVVMDRRWVHEHSDWFKPYVAGYYAFVYLGEDVTRDVAVERQGELLALEHRQLDLGAAS